ncbi:hypothetical protein, partial [Klebsiella pneumoniae]|uniref:hypothetical protein n=1 Tax=Klebsiella pneumoniae TaxID=573 RepID=UPI0039EEA555
VAEQEGQQTETEATGAPQKHHYTLNQQVGSITRFCHEQVRANTYKPIILTSKFFAYPITYRILICALLFIKLIHLTPR